jgi:hypothetical protein
VNAQYPSLLETFIFQPQQAPYGEDYHPSKITHLKMANELTQFIKSHNLYTHE